MKCMKRFWSGNAASYAMGLFMAVALKYHYSVAGSEGLRWVLCPTSWLVQWLAGIPLEWEEHTGFVGRLHGIIIAPSCGGVNFMIITFSSLFFTTGHLMPNGKWKIRWFGISLMLAYILTLGVNALRITAAVFLYQADIYGGWITPERVHRIEGTLIYFSCLLLAHLVVTTIVHSLVTHGAARATGWSMLVPSLWYCLVALGIPLLNSAHLQGGHRFVEHGSLVLFVCAGVLLFFAVLFLLWQRAAMGIRGWKKR